MPFCPVSGCLHFARNDYIKKHGCCVYCYRCKELAYLSVKNNIVKYGIKSNNKIKVLKQFCVDPEFTIYVKNYINYWIGVRFIKPFPNTTNLYHISHRNILKQIFYEIYRIQRMKS